MSYLVLARRFRPQTFDDIVGQAHVTKTLENAIKSGRVAHAFLFAGARGVGKTTTARVLAKALNCVEGPTTTPCGVCSECVGIAASRSVDVQEIDGASNNSVDDIRALRETVPYRPSSGRFKIYIVDEVHMLTTSAWNALLKTLEEPPEHVKFVFATTEPHKIPVTILSRCQRYDFRRVPTALILDRLRAIADAEEVQADEGALALLAREAEGSVRDSLSLLDQALAFDPGRLDATEVARLLGVADRKALLDLSAAILEGDAAAALSVIDQVAAFGVDLTRFSHDVLRHLRNLVVVRQCPDARDLVDLPEDERLEVARQVEGRDAAELHRLFLLFSRSCEELARSLYPRLLLEMSVARLAALTPMRSLEELSSRLEKIAGGASPRPPAGPGPERGLRGAEPPPARRPTPAPPPRGAAGPPRRGPGRAPRRAPTPDEGAPQDEGEPAPRPSAPPSPTAEDHPGVGRVAADEPRQDGGAWTRLLAHMEREAPALFHLLRYAEPAEVGRGLVRVRLPNRPFLKEEARKPERLEALRAACRAVLGGEPEVKLEVAEGSVRSAREREHIERAARLHDRKREATEHDAVRAALAEFEGAKIQQVKLIDDE